MIANCRILAHAWVRCLLASRCNLSDSGPVISGDCACRASSAPKLSAACVSISLGCGQGSFGSTSNGFCRSYCNGGARNLSSLFSVGCRSRYCCRFRSSSVGISSFNSAANAGSPGGPLLFDFIVSSIGGASSTSVGDVVTVSRVPDDFEGRCSCGLSRITFDAGSRSSAFCTARSVRSVVSFATSCHFSIESVSRLLSGSFKNPCMNFSCILCRFERGSCNHFHGDLE